MRRLLSEGRRVQLLIQLFNKINCWNVEGLKIDCLASAVFHGFFMIRLRQSNILIAVFCAGAHAVAISLYCGTFNRAYRMKEFQEGQKDELKVACVKRAFRAEEMEEQESFMAPVNAISCLGLKVGRFHEIERESALIFTNFVEQQIIGLLLTF